MYCDFATVTNMLSDQIVTSSIKSYNGFLNVLFASYLKSSGLRVFHRSESSKLSSGTRIATAVIHQDRTHYRCTLRHIVCQAVLIV